MPGTVLIVEDPFVSKYLCSLLAPKGYTIKTAGVVRGNEFIRSGQASVIVTNAPGEFLEFADRVPVVYLSSAPDPDLAHKFHCCHMVTKPFRAADLVSAIDDACAEAGAVS